MHRLTATFLVLVMLVPAFGSLALARTAAPRAMRCLRQPLRHQAPAAQPATHCHGMTQVPQPTSQETSVRALDCCQNHDCCRALKTSEGVRPTSIQLPFVRPLIAPALPVPFTAQASADRIAPDSARAPPRR